MAQELANVIIFSNLFDTLVHPGKCSMKCANVWGLMEGEGEGEGGV
jgi:hypothetical protein